MAGVARAVSLDARSGYPGLRSLAGSSLHLRDSTRFPAPLDYRRQLLRTFEILEGPLFVSLNSGTRRQLSTFHRRQQQSARRSRQDDGEDCPAGHAPMSLHDEIGDIGEACSGRRLSSSPLAQPSWPRSDDRTRRDRRIGRHPPAGYRERPLESVITWYPEHKTVPLRPVESSPIPFHTAPPTP